MSKNAYDKQVSMYTVQNGNGQQYGFASFVNDVEGPVHPDREPYDEQKLDKDKKLLKNQGIVQLPELPREHQESVEFPLLIGSNDGPLKYLPKGRGVGFPGSQIISRGKEWLKVAHSKTTLCA